MALVPTTLQLTDMSTKWGRVVVLNDDNTIKEEFIISAQKADKVVKREALPPELVDIWNSGKVILEARPCNPGQCVEGDNKTLMINTGINGAGKRVAVTLTGVPAELWENRLGVIWLDETVVRQLGL